MQLRKRSQLGAIALIAGLSTVIVPSGAAHATPVAHPHELASPTGMHVVKVSSSAFTVSAHHAANARRYRLFASTTRHNLAVASLSHAYASSLSARPQTSLQGLPYTTSPYYYRLEVINGPHHRYAKTIDEVGLRPARPAKLRVARHASGSYLTWNAGRASGFAITRSTSPDMSQNRFTYRIRGTGHQFTPPGLTRGRKYYFQVRALNTSTASAPSGTTALVQGSARQAAKVMTYNVLEASDDGRREGSGRIAPWSQRKLAAARLIEHANPDVIAVQEAASWVGRVKGPRQIDSLRAALGGRYALAHTEVPPSQPDYFRTGVYILYKKSTYRAVGRGNHWSLGQNRSAAYQVLRSRKTGAKFLFVSTHLAVGGGSHLDAARETETKRMIADARRRAASSNLPIIYGGDFNSEVSRQHAFDGPAIAMRAAHNADAYDVAQSRSNASYNSANGYDRRPPRNADHIDYVFTSPGVAVRSWRLVMRMSHGKLVGVIPSDHDPLVSTVDYS